MHACMDEVIYKSEKVSAAYFQNTLFRLCLTGMQRS